MSDLWLVHYFSIGQLMLAYLLSYMEQFDNHIFFSLEIATTQDHSLYLGIWNTVLISVSL